MKKLHIFFVALILLASCETATIDPQKPEPATLAGTEWVKHYNDQKDPWQKVLTFYGEQVEIRMSMHGRLYTYEVYEYQNVDGNLSIAGPFEQPFKGNVYADSLTLQGETYIRVVQ